MASRERRRLSEGQTTAGIYLSRSFLYPTASIEVTQAPLQRMQFGGELDSLGDGTLRGGDARAHSI